jgi:hypothetical protein
LIRVLVIVALTICIVGCSALETTGPAEVESSTSPSSASPVHTLAPAQSSPLATQTAHPPASQSPVALQPTATSTPLTVATPPTSAAPAGSAVLVGAGDIAACDANGDELTAALLDRLPGTVMALGDNAYASGSASEYADCYAPTWGRQKARTRPVPGNRDYATSGASGYFDYFGAAAGDPGKGYYGYDLNQYWHVVALNSNCLEVGGCSQTSAQYAWLSHELAEHAQQHIVAYWHQPRYSSGAHGDTVSMAPIWNLLYVSGVEIVVSAQDHDYERFAPMNGDGGLDAAYGVREFVVGTGGGALRDVGRLRPNSEVHDAHTFGVLQLVLYPDHYDWAFVPVEGAEFRDQGTSLCHDAPP